MSGMAPVTWKDIPVDLERRVLVEGAPAVAELASWAYRNRPYRSGDDEIQDVLCDLLDIIDGDAGRSQPITSLRAVLTAIGFRQRCDRIRDQMKFERARHGVAKSAATSTGAWGVPVHEFRLTVTAALSRLREDERQALLRKHVLGQSYKEIAVALFGPGAGAPEVKRVSVILARARTKLRERVRELGFES